MSLRTPLAIAAAAALLGSIAYTSSQNKPLRTDYGIYRTEGKGAEIEEQIKKAAKEGKVIELTGGRMHMGSDVADSWCLPCQKLDKYLGIKKGCTERYSIGVKPAYRMERDVDERPVSYEGYEEADVETALSQLGVSEISGLPMLVDFSLKSPILYVGFNAKDGTTRDAQGAKVRVDKILKCKK